MNATYRFPWHRRPADLFNPAPSSAPPSAQTKHPFFKPLPAVRPGIRVGLRAFVASWFNLFFSGPATPLSPPRFFAPSRLRELSPPISQPNRYQIAQFREQNSTIPSTPPFITPSSTSSPHFQPLRNAPKSGFSRLPAHLQTSHSSIPPPLQSCSQTLEQSDNHHAPCCSGDELWMACQEEFEFCVGRGKPSIVRPTLPGANANPRQRLDVPAAAKRSTAAEV
jgi:hypothetical protein